MYLASTILQLTLSSAASKYDNENESDLIAGRLDGLVKHHLFFIHLINSTSPKTVGARGIVQSSF
jgi:hypothetical protein